MATREISFGSTGPFLYNEEDGFTDINVDGYGYRLPRSGDIGYWYDDGNGNLSISPIAKSLISTNTTIYVATTGSDTTGTGEIGAPFATIAKALLSLASKVIATNVMVTIQVADGTYTITSSEAVSVLHPDGNRLQILGNTSSDVSIAIASIDIAAKTFTVVGDYSAIILVGDIVAVTGSSTGGLNGAYLVSAVIFAAGNTTVTCATETIASATVGGGSLIIKPCNRCVLSCASGVSGIFSTKLSTFNGFRINGAGGTASGILMQETLGTIGSKTIISGFTYGMQAANNGLVSILGGVIKGCTQGLVSSAGRLFVYSPGVILDNCSVGSKAQSGGYIYLQARIERLVTTQAQPVIGTLGGSLNLITTSLT